MGKISGGHLLKAKFCARAGSEIPESKPGFDVKIVPQLAPRELSIRAEAELFKPSRLCDFFAGVRHLILRLGCDFNLAGAERFASAGRLYFRKFLLF